MRKIYLFNLFDDLFNELNDFNKSRFEIDNSQFPSENDPNFNKVVNESETTTHTTKEEVWTSLDGSKIFRRVIVESKSKSIPHKDIKLLEQELKDAISSENFEKAAEIRDEIKKIKGE